MSQLVLKLAVVAAALSLAPAGAEDLIQWAPDLDKARIAAAQQKKLLLIHFYTPDCGPCKVVDAKVFPTPAVANTINANYIPLKVNAYQHADLRNHFGVQQWPTDIICTVDGHAVHRMVTDQNPGRYTNKLMVIASQHSPAKPSTTSIVQASSQSPGRVSTPQTQSANRYAGIQQSALPGGIPPRDIPESNALANRPGVDPGMHPGRDLHMQANRTAPTMQTTPAAPASSSFATLPTGTPPGGSTLSPGGTTNLMPQTAPSTPVEVTNRFAQPRQQQPIPQPQAQPQQLAAQAASMVAAMQTPSSEIRNPYASPPSAYAQAPTPAAPMAPAQQVAAATTSTPSPPAQQVVATQQPTAPPVQVQAQPTQPNVNLGQVAMAPQQPVAPSLQAAPTQQQPLAPQSRPQVAQTPVAQIPAAQPQAMQPQVARSQVTQPPYTQPQQSSVAATQSMAPQTPATGQRVDVTPINEPAPVGLDGRCPVTLITSNKWKPGDKKWGAIHRGKTYLFAGADEQKAFLADPDRYSPVLAGMDLVRLARTGSVVQGTRRYGVLFDDDGTGPRSSRIYLFDSVDSRNRFEANPDQYLQPVMEAFRTGTLDTLLR